MRDEAERRIHPSSFRLHPSNHRFSANARCKHASAAAPCVPSTITFTRTSLVLIISTLIPAAASDSNMRIATAAWLRMPMPETDSFATRGALVTPAAADPLSHRPNQGDRAGQIGLRHGEAQVRLAVAAEALHDHVDEDAGLGHRVENGRGDARPVGHAADRTSACVWSSGFRRSSGLPSLASGGRYRIAVLSAAVAGQRRAVDAGRLVGQLERRVDCPQRRLRLGAGDEHRNLDLAGGDHLDVHARRRPGRGTSAGPRRSCRAMPRPTTETLATSSSWLKPSAPSSAGRFLRRLRAWPAVRRGRR